jgi:hypothetical protein
MSELGNIAIDPLLELEYIPTMLLIYPPMAKASEPPSGIPLLAGALKAHNINYRVMDMNLGAQEYLLEQYFQSHPKKRHYRKLITERKTYEKPDSYQRIISELTKGLNDSMTKELTLSLANMEDSRYAPLNSRDLLKAAEEYSESPFYPYYKQSLTPLLLSGAIHHVGISLQYINQAVATFSLIGFIKAVYPKIRIILGGGLITSWGALKSWNNPFKDLVDKIITGAGEEKLLEYLGIEADPHKIHSIQPDFDWAKDLQYFSPGRLMPISGSQGCSWKRCKFCPELAEDSPYLSRNPKVVLEMMKQWEREYQPALFHFTDNEMSPTLLKTMALGDLNTPWYGFTKFYSLLKDPKFCKALKKGGCSMLKLGLESGDQRVLDFLNKGITLEDASLILKNLHHAGIKNYVYLLLGTPVEDLASALLTRDFTEAHAEFIDFLNLAIFNMPVQSKEFIISEEFQYSPADLSLYKGFNHPLGWNRGNIRRFLKEEFQVQPGVQKILRRTPPQFNANHAAFM